MVLVQHIHNLYCDCKVCLAGRNALDHSLVLEHMQAQEHSNCRREIANERAILRRILFGTVHNRHHRKSRMTMRRNHVT